MKKRTRLLAFVLAMVLLLGMFSGCSATKTDENLILTKGEFFAYFVYENAMTSEQYSSEEILNCKDGSVEADIIVEWGYLPEELAKKDLKKPVQKEIVVMVCANATFELKKGNVADIKDADLLEDAQLIADAYASGFFELDNGYFDGAQEMSFAACEEIMNNANTYTANFHFEADTEVTSLAEGVKEQDTTNYHDGDVIVEFIGETVEETAAEVDTKGKVTLLGAVTTEYGVDNGGVIYTTKEKNNTKIFTVLVHRDVFATSLGNPQIGDTVVLKQYQVQGSDQLPNGTSELMGKLVDMKYNGFNIVCTLECLNFEEAVQKKNVEAANGSTIDADAFVKEKTEVDGWKLEFNVTGDSIQVSAKKDFTVYETGRKQDWQNAKKTMTASANLKISNFNLDVGNLKSFATKKGTGFIKITCDTDVDFSMSQSLRYVPDSNRNGKFPSNWSNSRWTDADAKGAKSIKIARFPLSMYGVVNVDVYIYLLITMDGKVSFATSIEDGGVEISTNNGKISTKKLGTKTSEFTANVNLYNRFGVNAKVTIFKFVEVIEYDIGANVDLHAVANLYYEDKLSKSGVYADEEGMNEYAADDDKFSYCIDIRIEVSVSGELKDSGVKLIMDLMSAGDALNFKKMIWTGGIHFEDGHFADKCTRSDEETEEVEESGNDEVELGSYKLVLSEYTCGLVQLKAVPPKTIELMDSKNAITVASSNENICVAIYNPVNQQIIVEAVGEGSTEIVIQAKSNMCWWKEPYEQKISVTVTAAPDAEGKTLSFVVIGPAAEACRDCTGI